jgi:hypothetical protein
MADPDASRALPDHFFSFRRSASPAILDLMKITYPPHWLFAGALVAGVGVLGAFAALHSRAEDPPEAKRKQIANNVFFEVQGDERRVVVSAYVVLREGRLEGLLCRKNTKEHEYILAADADASLIHAALVAAGGKAGSPVQFQPKFTPANGSSIRIRLQYQKDGKTVTVPAQQWIRDVKTKKDLDSDWVFGGSHLLPDPEDAKKPPFYLANQGDVICLCNMDTAMLDLPIASPKALADRNYEANTDRIPPLDAKVDVIFDIVRDKKEKDK